jgi:hypothetical protein
LKLSLAVDESAHDLRGPVDERTQRVRGIVSIALEATLEEAQMRNLEFCNRWLFAISLLAASSLSMSVSADDTTFAQLPNGAARFEVTLPSAQAYVEVFVRQNGIQNTAKAIQKSEVKLQDKVGFSRYSLEGGSFKTGDKIEYRFYSYLPGKPGVFTPGKAESVWKTQLYGAACTSSFETTAGAFCLDAKAASQTQVYTASAKEWITPQSRGWALNPALLGELKTNALLDDAELLGVFVKVCATGKWVPIEETPYRPLSASEAIVGLDYVYTPQNLNTTFPGTKVRDTYACGGRFVTIPTLIGNQTLLTDASVEFAYVVEHLAN